MEKEKTNSMTNSGTLGVKIFRKTKKQKKLGKKRTDFKGVALFSSSTLFNECFQCPRLALAVVRHICAPKISPK
jgi:hypothetical protein